MSGFVEALADALDALAFGIDPARGTYESLDCQIREPLERLVHRGFCVLGAAQRSKCASF